MPKSFLVKRLTKVAAKVIQDTRTAGRVPLNAQEEYELVEIAFGGTAVEVDFEKWLNELKLMSVIPTYPVTEYLKVVKERLQDKTLSAMSAVPIQTPEEKKKLDDMIEQSRVAARQEVETRLAEIAAEQKAAAEIPFDKC